jgi:hypothetical protein
MDIGLGIDRVDLLNSDPTVLGKDPAQRND